MGYFLVKAAWMVMVLSMDAMPSWFQLRPKSPRLKKMIIMVAASSGKGGQAKIKIMAAEKNSSPKIKLAAAAAKPAPAKAAQKVKTPKIVAASKIAAVSRTLRVRTCSTTLPSGPGLRPGPSETRPRDGFRPTSPQALAGMRIEP